MPGIAAVGHALEKTDQPDPTLACFQIMAGTARHGELQLKVSNPEAFAPYEP